MIPKHKSTRSTTDQLDLRLVATCCVVLRAGLVGCERIRVEDSREMPTPSLRSFASFRRPPSPTLSATTSASFLDLGDDGPKILITRADLRASVAAYESLLTTAKAYRNALLALSTATTAFAGALEECARVKGAGESGDQLLAASGLQYMIANSGQVLSDTLYRSFEIPLLHAYDTYVATLSARHAEYEVLLAERTAAIRQTEADNLKQGRKKIRDLSQFRKALEKLQEQVREVEVCKKSYYGETLDHETDTWNMIGGKVALLLRSTLDLADRLSSKATSDPIIESMLGEHPDPFDSYRLETDEDRDVFTILPPLELGASGKRGSVIDLAQEAEDSTEEEDGKMATPRPAIQSKKVAEVLKLGLDQDDGDEEADDEQNNAQQDSTPTGKRTSAPGLVRSHPRIAGSASSVRSTHSESPTRMSATASIKHPSPISTPSQNVSPPTASSCSTAVSSALILPKHPPTTSSNRRTSRRPLSRVSEQESDPMSGDWDPTPSFGRTLSPVVNGLGGDGDEYESESEDELRRKGSEPPSPERRTGGPTPLTPSEEHGVGGVWS